MGEDVRSELAELLAAFDPDSIFRAIALSHAVQIDTTKDHNQVMAKASAFYDFIDPFSGDKDAADFRLTLAPKA